MNDYEKAKLLRVQENQERLRSLGVKNIVNSLTSLVQSKKTKKRKDKTTFNNENDVNYMSDHGGDGDENHREENDTSVAESTKRHRPQYIAPMSMTKYANIAMKKRVIAPNASSMLPVRDSCIRKGQSVDSGALKKCKSQRCEEGEKSIGVTIGKSAAVEKQLTETTTMADIILKNKGSEKQTKAFKQNIAKPISSGARRKLFVVDEDVDEDNNLAFQEMNEEHNCVENEDTEDMIFENIQNGIEEDDVSCEDVDEVDREEDGAEYEDEDTNHMRDDDELDYEAEYEEENVDHMIFDDELDNGVKELVKNQHEGPRSAEDKGAGTVQRRVRGPTRMRKIWGESEIIKVQFNEYGQPIDKKKTSQLTHFMGAVVRGGKYCPIYLPWPKVSDTKKHDLLKLVKTKFEIPESSYDWILASFAKKVRNWRARLKEYHDPSLPLKKQIKSRPERVRRSHWKKLVNYWNEEASKKLSEKNKEIRAKKKMVQVTGKKSYARVREELKASLGCEPTRMEMFRACFSKDGTTKNKAAAKAIKKMEKYKSKLPKGSSDKPGPEDTFSKVITNDPNGLARMFGLGVRASDVWGVIPSRSACRRENIELKHQKEQLEAKVARYEAKELEKEGSSEHGINDSIVPLRVGAEVYIRNIFNSSEILAKGRIKSLDPNEYVGGVDIGPGWCEVNIQTPIVRSARLVRPYDLFVTIEDVVGATTAWPCPFVSVMREEDP